MTGNFFQIRLMAIVKSSPKNIIQKESGILNNFKTIKTFNYNFFKGGESDINFFYNLFFL